MCDQQEEVVYSHSSGGQIGGDFFVQDAQAADESAVIQVFIDQWSQIRFVTNLNMAQDFR